MPPQMPGPSRRDLLIWGTGIVVAAAATLIASAAGARLGSALTAGVIALVAIVVGALALEARDRSRR
jgi:hypothetical protein